MDGWREVLFYDDCCPCPTALLSNTYIDYWHIHLCNLQKKICSFSVTTLYWSG